MFIRPMRGSVVVSGYIQILHSSAEYKAGDVQRFFLLYALFCNTLAHFLLCFFAFGCEQLHEYLDILSSP